MYHAPALADLIDSANGSKYNLMSRQLMSGHVFTHSLIPLWNALMRLGFFLIVTIILSRLSRYRHSHSLTLSLSGERLHGRCLCLSHILAELDKCLPAADPKVTRLFERAETAVRDDAWRS